MSNTASDIAAAIRGRRATARAVTEAALARIALENPTVNAFTDITAERALARADAIDAQLAEGRDPGPLAGVPFAVKNLFDIAGLPTRAGSRINRDRAPPRATPSSPARWKRPAPSCLAASTWANTPTTSPARTRMTAPPAIRATSRA
ncbi:amidase family protein [Teichococcus aestuarii]|uniref:amidase family protein n=1 Tax=Teichococcus aestuarii TaxID=568898 RepID=UPI00360802CD